MKMSVLVTLGFLVSSPAWATSTYTCTSSGTPKVTVIMNFGAAGSLSDGHVSLEMSGKTERLFAPGVWLDERRLWIRAVDDQATKDVLMLKFNRKSNKGILWFEKAVSAGQEVAPIVTVESCSITG
jgi:hypothetical protein